uniref:AlNc14C72G4925 protein n=1 Tax=Albugo laibachii Nc14 TaxID=890382 RepID=F0WE69_9STRA|nr:AlNc14C72G4925 [Albugo laibachii Nc14]|eukprot:CCA19498.1 AlNc14C72G4925 [Albugo laibachii Nc14]
MRQIGAEDGIEQEESQSSQLPFSDSSTVTPPVHRLRRFRQNQS